MTADPAEVGRKVLAGAARGGRRNPDRDLRMAREFRQRRALGGFLSDTALKVRIGKAYGLRRAGAVRAVDRGLKKLFCLRSGEVDDIGLLSRAHD